MSFPKSILKQPGLSRKQPRRITFSDHQKVVLFKRDSDNNKPMQSVPPRAQQRNMFFGKPPVENQNVNPLLGSIRPPVENQYVNPLLGASRNYPPSQSGFGNRSFPQSGFNSQPFVPPQFDGKVSPAPPNQAFVPPQFDGGVSPAPPSQPFVASQFDGKARKASPTSNPVAPQFDGKSSPTSNPVAPPNQTFVAPQFDGRVSPTPVTNFDHVSSSSQAFVASQFDGKVSPSPVTNFDHVSSSSQTFVAPRFDGSAVPQFNGSTSPTSNSSDEPCFQNSTAMCPVVSSDLMITQSPDILPIMSTLPVTPDPGRIVSDDGLREYLEKSLFTILQIFLIKDQEYRYAEYAKVLDPLGRIIILKLNSNGYIDYQGTTDFFLERTNTSNVPYSIKDELYNNSVPVVDGVFIISGSIATILQQGMDGRRSETSYDLKSVNGETIDEWLVFYPLLNLITLKINLKASLENVGVVNRKFVMFMETMYSTTSKNFSMVTDALSDRTKSLMANLTTLHDEKNEYSALNSIRKLNGIAQNFRPLDVGLSPVNRTRYDKLIRNIEYRYRLIETVNNVYGKLEQLTSELQRDVEALSLMANEVASLSKHFIEVI